MIKNFLWLLKYVRTEILESFILPELNISYWDFCIILAVVSIAAVVLLNSVRISGTASIRSNKNRSKDDNRKKG